MRKNEFIILFICAVFFISISVGVYYLQRWFNYSFSYHHSVIDTIREEVKPECLVRNKD